MQNWKKIVFNILARSIVIEYDMFTKWVLYTLVTLTQRQDDQTRYAVIEPKNRSKVIIIESMAELD